MSKGIEYLDNFLRFNIAVFVATAFNVILVAVICFGVIPKVDQTAQSLKDDLELSRENQQAIMENRNLLLKNKDDLEERRKIIIRFDTLLRNLLKRIEAVEKKQDKP